MVLNGFSKNAGWKPKNGFDGAVRQCAVDCALGLSARKASAQQLDTERGKLESEFDRASEYFIEDIRGYRAVVKDV